MSHDSSRTYEWESRSVRPRSGGQAGESGMDNGETFAERVYRVVASIPDGCVTTYGAIALALDKPRGARMVGWALSSVPEQYDLPCHRVVNREGYLSGGWSFGHPDRMKQLLLDEGVPFRGEYHVDLAACLWIPEDVDDSAAADEVDDFDDVTG